MTKLKKKHNLRTIIYLFLIVCVFCVAGWYSHEKYQVDPKPVVNIGSAITIKGKLTKVGNSYVLNDASKNAKYATVFIMNSDQSKIQAVLGKLINKNVTLYGSVGGDKDIASLMVLWANGKAIETQEESLVFIPSDTTNPVLSSLMKSYSVDQDKCITSVISSDSEQSLNKTMDKIDPQIATKIYICLGINAS